MALSTEERQQVKALFDGGWDEDSIVCFIVLAQLTKIPIPGVAVLWETASVDFNEMYPVVDDEQEFTLPNDQPQPQ